MIQSLRLSLKYFTYSFQQAIKAAKFNRTPDEITETERKTLYSGNSLRGYPHNQMIRFRL